VFGALTFFHKIIRIFKLKLNSIFPFYFRYHSVSEIEYNDLVVPEETAQKEMAERLKLVDVKDKS